MKYFQFIKFRLYFKKHTGLKFPLTINEIDDFADYCEVKCNVRPQ